MHLQTHALLGWNAGNLIPRFGARERFFCMAASLLPDLDGLSMIAGWEVYLDYHHVLGHNLLFIVVASTLLAWFSKPRILSFFTYLVLMHIHLLMDYFGSGEGWTISYFWPFSNHEFGTHLAWEFYSWQNLTAGGLMILWMLAIIVFQRRTPLEYPMPKLDKQLVELFGKLKF